MMRALDCYAEMGWSLVARFQGRSSEMRLIEWLAMRWNTRNRLLDRGRSAWPCRSDYRSRRPVHHRNQILQTDSSSVPRPRHATPVRRHCCRSRWAVFRVTQQRTPASQRIANRCRDLGLAGYHSQCRLQPLMERLQQRTSTSDASLHSLVRRPTSNLALDGVQLGDALQGFTANDEACATCKS